MKLARHATIAEDGQTSRADEKVESRAYTPQTKRFTAEELRSVTRSHFFMGAVSFWREVERLTQIEEAIRIHACSVLRMATTYKVDWTTK